MDELQAANGIVTDGVLAAIPDGFLDANRVSREAVARVLRESLGGLPLARDRPPLIGIDQIASFQKAAEVTPPLVAAISRPLALPERTVKEFVALILGEPRIDKDWGGEPDDLFSTRVVLIDRAVPASFILKGPGKAGPLTISKLGRNGDQLERMLDQPATLFVVQHCDSVRPAVHKALRRGILALRAEGHEEAVGSVWDGSDCARLLVAHGLIDPRTGLPVGNG